MGLSEMKYKYLGFRGNGTLENRVVELISIKDEQVKCKVVSSDVILNNLTLEYSKEYFYQSYQKI